MSYTPPPYNQIYFAFSNAGYTPPPHDQISFAFGLPPGYLLGIGWNDLLFGTPAISLFNRELAPSGWDAFVAGTASIRNQSEPIGAPGISDGTYGTPFIAFADRPVAPAGVASQAFGSALFGGGIRSVFPADIFSQAFGVAFISVSYRELHPLWWIDTFFGAAMVGNHRDVAPAGIDSLIFGATTVRDNRQYPGPFGWDALLAGRPFVAFGTRTLRAAPVEAGDVGRWSVPKVHNLRQFIAPEYAADRWIEGGFGDEQIMWIRNVNRVVDLVGNGIKPPFRGVSPFASLRNNGRFLGVSGQVLARWGNNQVAHATRSVFPSGFDSFRTDRFNNVYNAAQQILPAGISDSRIGTPALLNTRRWITYAGAGQQSSFGVPFVAPRVRTLAPTQLQRPGGWVGLATVWYSVRTLAPTQPAFGWGSFFGVPALAIHRNIVQAASVSPIDGVSTAARLHNVTPEVRPTWYTDDFTRWGMANVFNEYEPLPVQGWDNLAFGAHGIADRTLRPLMAGFDAFRANNLHRVRNVIPDPPGPQYLANVSIGSTEAQGQPALHANSLFPQGIFGTAFGVGIIYGNGLRPAGIPPIFDDDTGGQCGIPSLNGQQFLIPETIGLTEVMGKPRFSPLTIWAPYGAPDQAILNHPPGRQELIDTFLNPNDLTRPLFGLPTVELKNRRIVADSLPAQDSYGFAVISETPIRVGVLGNRMTKYGIPVLNGGGRVDAHSPLTMDAMGEPSVAAIEPFIRTLRPAAFSSMRIGVQWVANFNRDIPVAGADMLLVGTQTVQRPPPPAEPAGFIATLWGDGTFIDFRIRNVYPEGDDLLRMVFELGSFADRMRVTSVIGYGSLVISAGDQLQVGTPTLDGGIRGLSVSGIAPPVMPVPRARAQNRINVADTAPFDVFGETWALAVTPGTIQPRGEAMSGYGLPALARTISPAGFTGEFGTAWLRHFVGATGFDAAQFGEPVIIGFGCGTRVRAISGWDAFVAGSPVVAHA